MNSVDIVRSRRKTSKTAETEVGKVVSVNAVRRRGDKTLGLINASDIQQRTFSTHQELLDDMAAFGLKLTETPGAAREFLISAGLLTKSGKPKQLIRG